VVNHHVDLQIFRHRRPALFRPVSPQGSHHLIRAADHLHSLVVSLLGSQVVNHLVSQLVSQFQRRLDSHLVSQVVNQVASQQYCHLVSLVLYQPIPAVHLPANLPVSRPFYQLASLLYSPHQNLP